ncbi:putative knottin, scorpion toxin [Medicago truncatula]|nr:putative knottin, scorpion toxin [Medicago truncatula]
MLYLHIETMSFFASNVYIVFMFLNLILLLLSTCEVEAEVCRKKSITWLGLCINNLSCSTTCVSEHALYGACQGDYVHCNCYFTC